MIWRFTILDRNNIATVIDEPVGWDANTSEIKRDLDWHGIVFTNQGQNFQFGGTAKKILEKEYEQYGIEGNLILIMEEDCGNGFEEFCRGNFMFKDFEVVCGDECYVKCPIETAIETKDLRNRLNQKVNLETTRAFDEVTNLAPYTKLPFDILLPSKGIPIKDLFEQEKDFETPVAGVPFNNNPSNTANSEFGIIEIGFDKTTASEIGNAGPESQSIYTCISTWGGTNGCTSLNRFSMPLPLNNEIAPLDITPYVNFQEGTLNYDAIENPCKIDILISGLINEINCQIANGIFILCVLPNNYIGDKYTDYNFLAIQPINNASTGGSIPLYFTYSNSKFILNKGDRIYCFISLYHYRTNASINTGIPAFKMKFNAGNYFSLTNLSHTSPTTSKVFAVNETLSRIAESITNDKLRAYSEYYGRTDSQPYSHAVDGCGSLKVITDGIRIRKQENRILNNKSLFTISLQDAFEGLNPIDNIGMGIEKDTNRVGYNRLRVEPWQYFYNNSTIFSCTNVGKITRKCDAKEIFSTFQFGYAKWEAEEYTGLDEFLTKRTYRTTLNQVKNDLIKLSKFIASGFALEITRRKGDNNSKDWRYDKDTFIICVTRKIKLHTIFNSTNNTIKIWLNGNTYPTIPATFIITGTASNNGTYTLSNIGNAIEIDGDSFILTFGLVQPVINEECYSTQINNFLFDPKLSVELGNVKTPQHITDPVTLYNYRISPIRNAMRWMNRVLESYKQFNANAKIIFTDGDANYYAQGEMEDTDCKLENNSIVENQTIDLSVYADANNAKPFLSPERVTFDYPMNSKDYKLLVDNPYGLIYFSNDCEDGFGWIDTIQYKPEEGKGTFTLIPKTN